MGIFTNSSASADFYIADSVFLGRNDPKHLTDLRDTDGGSPKPRRETPSMTATTVQDEL
jgi:hypothetical protein